MIRKFPLYKILSAIHIVFFTSMLCFGLIFASASILLLPALGAAFAIGKEFLYDDLDITNSIIASYFRYLKQSLRLLRHFGVNIVLLLNLGGMLGAVRMRSLPLSIISLTFFSILLTLSLYMAGYFVFVDETFSVEEVMMAMFLKPLHAVTVMIVMVLCSYFFSGTLAAILFFMGTFFLFVLEVVVFTSMLYYKKFTGKLDEEDAFAYLVNGKKKDQK